MRQLFLSHDVYFCCCGDSLVFLDLNRDDYVLVDGELAQAVEALCSQDGCESFTSAAVLSPMLTNGFLTTDPLAGKSVAPTTVEPGLVALLDPDELPGTHIRSLDVFHFLSSCLAAAIQLKWRPLSEVIRLVKQRKMSSTSLHLPSIDQSRQLTAVFLKLRALFPSNYLCLYDSLALIHFLARYGIYPSWIFAVNLEPWAAHCWVQDGATLFNEGVEEAARYTPVMAI